MMSLLVWLSHNSLFTSRTFSVSLEILINFVASKKSFYLLKILSRKPSFLKKIWPIDVLSILSVVATQQ